MQSKFAMVLLCCVLAGSYSAQAAPGKQELNLDAKEGAEYFHFAEGAQLKVTGLYCPAAVTVSVTCRTAAHARCGKWYLGLNGTAASGPKGDIGIASLDYSGPDSCKATVVVTSP
jgi:hypothetical protein